MKIPRNISGKDLIKVLKPLGYEVTRQVGSHIRLTRLKSNKDHITIPNHKPIKVGTLSAILKLLAEQNGLTKQEIIDVLFLK